MALGGDSNQDAESSASALFRRWYRLRDSCCGQLSQATDAEVLHLRKKLDKLENDIIGYGKEQDTKGDPFWLGKSAFKMLIDIREAIANFRIQLENVTSCIEPELVAESLEDFSPVVDVLEEEEFLLNYESIDDEKPEVKNPSSRFHSTRILRNTLQGSVMFGIDGDTGEYVALKISSKDAVFKQQSLNGEKIIEDPINEVRLLEQLNIPGHRNVIRLIDSLQDEENYWMVLEYCSGGELFDLISESGRLDENSAANYFIQLARALEYIHSQGVCHLDLSLENVILTEAGELKLTDFGLARQFDKKAFSGCYLTKPGKIAYMSPEVFAGQDFNGGQADMYSAGVVLFVMLFGCPPYEIPAPSDRRFRLIFYGEIRELLQKWQMSTSPLALDLLSGLLCAADERLTAKDVLEHPWLSHCDISC